MTTQSTPLPVLLEGLAEWLRKVAACNFMESEATINRWADEVEALRRPVDINEVMEAIDEYGRDCAKGHNGPHQVFAIEGLIRLAFAQAEASRPADAGVTEEQRKQDYDEGWATCAVWAHRDDLIADCSSKAYDEDRSKGLARALLATTPAKSEPVAQPTGVPQQAPILILDGLAVLERMDYRIGDSVLVENFLRVMGERGMFVIENPLITASPTAPAQPVVPSVQPVRMLTKTQMGDLMVRTAHAGKGNVGIDQGRFLISASVREFCEVNNITIGATSTNKGGEQ